jgi:hypothetical protein
MAEPSDSPGVPVGPVQLNGWKDIAAYLGRSVRTAQRWEKDFGLPIRRFGVSKPESVFALPREIDAWLETAQGINARSGAGPGRELAGEADASARETVPEAGRNPRSLFPKTWVIRMATAAVIYTAVIATALVRWGDRLVRWTAQPAPAAAPADWHVDLDSLVVSDASGRELWKHKFPRDLIPGAYQDSVQTPRAVLGGIADIEGDGTREVWFVAKSPGGPSETALCLFEHDGRVRWIFRPTGRVRFGADTFGPSWIVDRAFVTADPAGGPGRAIWAVLYDSALFPSSIQRVDPRTGEPSSAYWTNGSIVAAALDASASPPKLLVGACYNETKDGSLSVLDALNPNGSAPAELDKYRCTACPPGEPLAFLVFPKPARFRTLDATGPVETITPLADGMLGVRVRYATPDPGTKAVGVFMLDASLHPVLADSADGYLKAYDAFVRRGDVPAGAPADVDPDREFFPIRRWDSGKQRYVDVFRWR